MRFPLLALALVAVMLSTGAVTTVPAFQFTCGTSALRIAPPSDQPGNYSSITVWNASCTAGTCTTSATPVFLGGRFGVQEGSLVTAVTTATGMPICNSSTACIAVAATYDVKNLQCISASPVTVTVQVAR